VISRRALLGTGVGAVALAGAIAVGSVTHRLDDVADTLGIEPRPRPVGSDDVLIASVAKNQDLILTAIEATAAHHPDLADKLAPYAKIAQSHLTAVGGSSTVPTAKPVDPDPVVAVKSLAQTLSTASTVRAKDARRAVSPDLARVLSSMSAGLAQSARTLGALV
jgi:hypothetical protein